MKLANGVYLTRAGMRQGDYVLKIAEVRAIFSKAPPESVGCSCRKCKGVSITCQWKVVWVPCKGRLWIGCVRFSPNDVKAVRAYLGKRPRKARAK